MEKTPDEIIPRNETGNESNNEDSVECASVEEAKRFFEVVKRRLLHVNQWQDLAGALTADFQLTDAAGAEVDRAAQEGDHFKIDIPGPGPLTGEGFDWVRVEKIEEHNDPYLQSIVMRVRPATNPQNERKDVAHFFDPEATSSFVAKREATKVTAAVYGRNEKPNTDAETALDNARNTAVAAGAVTAFSKLQWKSLVKGLVGEEQHEE